MVCICESANEGKRLLMPRYHIRFIRIECELANSHYPIYASFTRMFNSNRIR